MKKYDILVDELLNEMDRRQFIKMMGKGAAATGLAPKGVAGKILGAAAGGAAKPNPVALSAAIQAAAENWIKWTTYGGDPKVAMTNVHASALSLLNLFKQYKSVAPKANTYMIERQAMLTVKMTDPKMIEDRIKKGDFDNYAQVEQEWQESAEAAYFDDELFLSMHENGMLTPAFRQKMIKQYHIDPGDYVDEIREKEWAQRKLDKQDIAPKKEPNIEYSRMDTAGGSEDVGYAKHFESFFIENYADGKKPGRKGLAKRKGVNCKQSVSKLRKVAKNSSGERQRMAHWCANMKSGKKKKK